MPHQKNWRQTCKMSSWRRVHAQYMVHHQHRPFSKTSNKFARMVQSVSNVLTHTSVRKSVDDIFARLASSTAELVGLKPLIFRLVDLSCQEPLHNKYSHMHTSTVNKPVYLSDGTADRCTPQMNKKAQKWSTCTISRLAWGPQQESAFASGPFHDQHGHKETVQTARKSVMPLTRAGDRFQ